MSAEASKKPMPEQLCDWCGEPLGRFFHRKRYDGPLSCGAPECERECRGMEQEERERAQYAAGEDNYELYR